MLAWFDGQVNPIACGVMPKDRMTNDQPQTGKCSRAGWPTLRGHGKVSG